MVRLLPHGFSYLGNGDKIKVEDASKTVKYAHIIQCSTIRHIHIIKYNTDNKSASNSELLHQKHKKCTK